MKLSTIICTVFVIAGAYFWWQPHAWHQLKQRVSGHFQPTGVSAASTDKPEITAADTSKKTVYRYRDDHGNMAYAVRPPADRPSTPLTLRKQDISTVSFPSGTPSPAENKDTEKAANPYTLSDEQKKLLNPVDRMRLESAEIQYQMQAHREKMIDEVVNE